ncbi:hypothetical protein AB0L06_00565 [Spirillospora sp. NPDC052269]
MSDPTSRPSRRSRRRRAEGRPAEPQLVVGEVVRAWSLVWGVAVLTVPAFYAAYTTGQLMIGFVFTGLFALIFFSCGFITKRRGVVVWQAIVPLLAVMLGVGALIPSLLLRYEGKDVQGEFVLAWTTGVGKTREDHCRVRWVDSGTRHEAEIDGCPKRFYELGAPNNVPVRFVVSPADGVKGQLGTRKDISLTRDEWLIGGGVALLAGMTAWAVIGAVRRQRRWDASRPDAAGA